MRVKISTNPPLPPVKAWFPLSISSGHSCALVPTVSSFKSTLCTSLPAFRGVEPSSLHLSIDGFELLDSSELTVIKDGDLICVDRLDVPSGDATVQHLGQAVCQSVSQATQTRLESVTSRKRKRRVSMSSSSSSESSHETESTTSSGSSSESSDSESELEPLDLVDSVCSMSSSAWKVKVHNTRGRAQVTSSARPKPDASDSELKSESSDLENSVCSMSSSARKGKVHNTRGRAQVTSSAQPKPDASAFVPPGYGKPQTRSRNLRRRSKRVREHSASNMPEDGPASGANAVGSARVAAITPTVGDAGSTPTLLSLSLRNKNKAKNFKSLINRPLAPKIVFGDQEGVGASTGEIAPASMPRLVPPSSRSPLPANMFVTSVDVEADLKKQKKKERVNYGEELETLDYGDDVDKLEAMANACWDTLAKATRDKEMVPGAIVGRKALGINPVTYTPEQCVTLGRVASCDSEGVLVRLLREEASFGGPMEPVEEKHTWDEIEHADWRIA